MIGRAMEAKQSLTDELQGMLEQSEKRHDASTHTGVPHPKSHEVDETTGLHRVTSHCPECLRLARHTARPATVRPCPAPLDLFSLPPRPGPELQGRRPILWDEWGVFVCG